MSRSGLVHLLRVTGLVGVGIAVGLVVGFLLWGLLIDEWPSDALQATVPSPDDAVRMFDQGVTYSPTEGLELRRIKCEQSDSGIDFYIEVANPHTDNATVLVLIGTAPQEAPEDEETFVVSGQELVEIEAQSGRSTHLFHAVPTRQETESGSPAHEGSDARTCTAEVYGIDPLGRVALAPGVVIGLVEASEPE